MSVIFSHFTNICFTSMHLCRKFLEKRVDFWRPYLMEVLFLNLNVHLITFISIVTDLEGSVLETLSWQLNTLNQISLPVIYSKKVEGPKWVIFILNCTQNVYLLFFVCPKSVLALFSGSDLKIFWNFSW